VCPQPPPSPTPHTQVSLLYANVSEEDIILKDHIDRLAKAHPGQLSVYYVVDRTSSWVWKGGVGT
jgi:cytochrome-b5 reductase